MQRAGFRLVAAIAVGLVGSAADAVGTAFPFFDDVEATSRTQGYWTPGDVTKARVSTLFAVSGNQSWELDGRALLTLSGTLDLSGAANPYLAFWVGGSGSYSVDISYNAGVSWEGLIGNPSGVGAPQWTHVQAELRNYDPNYHVANVLVRIVGTSGYPFYVDDILVDNAPTPQPVRLSNSTDHAMRVSWGQSTAVDFRRYRVVLSSDATVVNDAWGRPSLTGRTERRAFDVTNRTRTDTTLTDLAFAGTVYYAKVYEEDTQGLVNQGSDAAEWATSLTMTPEVGPFVQDLEGVVQWAADYPWAITTADSTEAGHSGRHAWEDSPGTSYLPDADRWLVMRMDLSGVARPVLRWKHRYSFEEGYAAGIVSCSTDAVHWTDLGAFGGVPYRQWQRETFDLGVLGRHSQAFLRFRVWSGGGTGKDGWHLDDVEVSENARRTTYPFSDDVEVDSLTQRNWIEGAWRTRTTSAHSGVWAWEWAWEGARRQNFWSYLTLAGPLDLSAAVHPRMTYWVRSTSGAYFTTEISTNGGSSWEPLLPASYLYSATRWVSVQASLEAYRMPNVVLRIGCQSTDILVDDVSVRDMLFGDVSVDASVSALDAAQILQHVAGLVSLSGADAAAADVSGNGTISGLDASLVLQHVAGLIACFPAESACGAAKRVAGSTTLAWLDPKPADGMSGLVLLPIALQGEPQDVTSVQFTVRADPNAVSIEKVVSALPSDWQLVSHVAGQELRVVMAGVTPVSAGDLATVHLRVLDPTGQATLSGDGFVNEDPVMGLSDVVVHRLPATYALEQNCPNPFNSQTLITYRLPETSTVRIGIYDVSGRVVRSYLRPSQAPGVYVVRWDGLDGSGLPASTGTYIYRIQTSGFTATRKMLLAK